MMLTKIRDFLALYPYFRTAFRSLAIQSRVEFKWNIRVGKIVICKSISQLIPPDSFKKT